MAGERRRVLALDPGEQRIGVAVSDLLGHSAQPWDVIHVRGLDDTVAQVAALCAELEVGSVIVGLPLNMDGSRGPGARKAEALAVALREKLDVPVITWDERLTTAAAERLLISGQVRRRQRRQVRDKLAAALILQSYLDCRSAKTNVD